MPAETHPELAALRRQVFIQLVAFVVLAACLTALLYRQASQERKQIKQAMGVITSYKRQEPTVINVLNQLVAYGQKHPDFSRAVLKKYGLETAGTK